MKENSGLILRVVFNPVLINGAVNELAMENP
jgi:hypothetical protein